MEVSSWVSGSERSIQPASGTITKKAIRTGLLTFRSDFSLGRASVMRSLIFPREISVPQASIPWRKDSPLTTTGEAPLAIATQQPSPRGATKRCSGSRSRASGIGIPAAGERPTVACSPSTRTLSRVPSSRMIST